MDRKTFEYMNEKAKEYKKLASKKSDVEEELKNLDAYGCVKVPEDVKESVKIAIKHILKDYIQDLEKEMEEI